MIVDKTSKDGIIGYNDEKHKYFFMEESKRDLSFISVTTYISSLGPKFKIEEKSLKKAKELGKSQDYVLDMWEKNRIRAATDGTYIHSVLEYLSINGMPITLERWHPKLNGAFKFYEDFIKSGKYEVLEVEGLVYFVDEERGVFLAGQRDIKLKEKKTGKILSMDFKTNDIIRREGFYSKDFQGPEMLSGSFSHLQSCDFNKYTIQLNIYDFFDPEEEKADEMYIVHITEFGYTLIQVEKLDLYYDTELKSIELKEKVRPVNVNKFVIGNKDKYKLNKNKE